MRAEDSPGTSPFKTPPAGVEKAVLTYDRLGILDEIADGGGESTFQSLRFYLRLTPGSLGNHLTKLEEAGLIRVEKGFEGKKPLTRAVMTETGWRVYDDLDARMREWTQRNEERRGRRVRSA